MTFKKIRCYCHSKTFQKIKILKLWLLQDQQENILTQLDLYQINLVGSKDMKLQWLEDLVRFTMRVLAYQKDLERQLVEYLQKPSRLQKQRTLQEN